jgi:hypothetical protein
VEGGGQTRRLQAPLRAGLSVFFKVIIDALRKKRVNWHLILCGSRNETFRDFMTALVTHPTAYNVLLIDSEEPVTLARHKWDYLKQHDRFDTPHIDDDHCHFMVCTMEAWLIADIDALVRYYGSEFNRNSIPMNPSVEEITKQTLFSSLKTATRHTGKGEYDKSRDAPKLLELLDVPKVRQSAPHCERFFSILLRELE